MSMLLMITLDMSVLLTITLDMSVLLMITLDLLHHTNDRIKSKN